MKKATLFLALFLGLGSMLNAQWVSPGNGTVYTLTDLVDITNGVVTNGPNGLCINDDLTISTNDVLKIDDQVLRVDIKEVLININGSIVCTNNNRVRFYGMNETEHFSICFEKATGCELKNLYFSDGAGIKVIDSEITFDDVKFVYFTTGYCHSVIDIFNCNPTIENCYFLLNEGAAIGSPANGESSPKIINCELDSNVLRENIPQINLGPGAEDTIFIIGNLIDGTYADFHTGGISIADLLEIGKTKVLLKDNTIKNNRYGYNQQGYHIDSKIIGNIIVDNHHEDNPMNGGSGISIYGMDANNKAIIRENVITGNLWGITAINAFEIDLGNINDWGNNRIYNNGNSGEDYDLYNNSSYDIKAVGNDWGTTNENKVEDHIYHQYDDPSLGWVNYVPYIGYDAIEEAENIVFMVSPNPAQGHFTVEGKGKMTIVNTLGQILLTKDLDGQETIDLPRGLYLVRLNNDVRKVVVE